MPTPCTKRCEPGNCISLKKKDLITPDRPTAGTSKSTGSVNDAAAPIGMGATDTAGRLLASVFKSGPQEPTFCSCLDVPNGGVLLGLSGLLSMGLLRHTEKYFHLLNGYYRLDSIFLLLAFMALARIKTIEDLRYCSPGEWGKLLALDRIPETKTLREKVHLLVENDLASQWGGALSQDWMGMFPETTDYWVNAMDGHRFSW